MTWALKSLQKKDEKGLFSSYCLRILLVTWKSYGFFFIHKTRSTRILNNLQYIPIVILQITINKYNRLINSFWTKNWFIKILDKVSNAFVTRIRPLEFHFEIEPSGHLIYELIFHLGISRDSLFPRAPRKFYQPS